MLPVVVVVVAVGVVAVVVAVVAFVVAQMAAAKWLDGPDVVDAPDPSPPPEPEAALERTICTATKAGQARLYMEMMKSNTPSWLEHEEREKKEKAASLCVHGISRSSGHGPMPKMPPPVHVEPIATDVSAPTSATVATDTATVATDIVIVTTDPWFRTNSSNYWRLVLFAVYV